MIELDTALKYKLNEYGFDPQYDCWLNGWDNPQPFTAEVRLAPVHKTTVQFRLLDCNTRVHLISAVSCVGNVEV